MVFPILVSCSSSNDSSTFSASEINEDKTYKINIYSEEGIETNGLALDYKENDLVAFSIESELKDRYELEINRKSGSTIRYIGNNPYSFIMPSEDVNIIINYYQDDLGHDVYVYDSNHAFIKYKDIKYKENETVSFKVFPNYSDEPTVKVYDSYNQEILLNKENNDYYFKMPSRPAFISVNNIGSTIENNIIVEQHDSKVIIDNFKNHYDKGEKVTFDIKPSKSGNPNVSIKDQNNNNVPFELNNGQYSFIMPDEMCYLYTSIDPITKTSLDDEYLNKGYRTLIKDHNFNDGFKVRKWENYGDYIFDNNLNIYPSINEPSWHISQWMTDHEIDTDNDSFYQNDINIDEHYISSGDYYDKLAKTLYFNSRTGAFSLTSNTQYEYSNCTNIPYGKPTRASGYTDNFWVHFLLEQAYYGSELVYIDDHNEMIMDTTFIVSKNQKYTQYYSDCAQFEWYLAVQNRNKEAENLYQNVMNGSMSEDEFYSIYPDYGQYMWIGLYLWDSRYEGQYNGDFSRLEYGSNLYLYLPSTDKTFVDKDVFPLTNEKAHAKYDIRDSIEEQFSIAKNRFKDLNMDYFQHTELSDLAIGAMNIGLEMPCSRNVTVDIKEFGFYYK